MQNALIGLNTTYHNVRQDKEAPDKKQEESKQLTEAQKESEAKAKNVGRDIYSICKTNDPDRFKKFVTSKMKDAPHLAEKSFYVTGDSAIFEQFAIQEYPHCVLVDQAGLIAWAGHPDHRDLHLDYTELLAERSLVDTEDWLDDPDEPQLDPDEIHPKNLP